MVSNKRLRFKEAAPIAVIVIGAALAYNQIKASEWSGQSIASIRSAYAEIRNRKDGARLLQDRLNRTQNESVAAEYLLLIAAMGVNNPPEDFLEGLLARHYPTGSTQRSRMILDALRARYMLFGSNDSMTIQGYKSLALANAYPYDFAAQALFAREPYEIGIHQHEIARAIVERAEELSDKHPVTYRYRGWLEEMQIFGAKTPEPRKRSLRLFRLYEYARHTEGMEPRFQDKIDYLVRSLLAENIVPPEPTAKEYLVIKRRGWSFTPQMLEPFKRVK